MRHELASRAQAAAPAVGSWAPWAERGGASAAMAALVLTLGDGMERVRLTPEGTRALSVDGLRAIWKVRWAPRKGQAMPSSQLHWTAVLGANASIRVILKAWRPSAPRAPLVDKVALYQCPANVRALSVDNLRARFAAAPMSSSGFAL